MQIVKGRYLVLAKASVQLYAHFFGTQLAVFADVLLIV